MSRQDQFLRYYVWTPGGSLLYMIDAANSNKVYFYHFDRTGSTLALTDSSGIVTDKYAYDPYGELLSHQGTSMQPFTFVGQWGVRQEGTGGVLYHMRARYYDAITQRFISRELLWPLLSDPRRINRYQYTANNPVRKLDPNGLYELDDEEFARRLASMGYQDLATELNQLNQEIAWLGYMFVYDVSELYWQDKEVYWEMCSQSWGPIQKEDKGWPKELVDADRRAIAERYLEERESNYKVWGSSSEVEALLIEDRINKKRRFFDRHSYIISKITGERYTLPPQDPVFSGSVTGSRESVTKFTKLNDELERFGDEMLKKAFQHIHVPQSYLEQVYRYREM